MSIGMSKKLFYIFGLIAVLSVLSNFFLSNIARGADDASSCSNIFACGNLTSKLQLNTGLSSDWSDVFGTDDPKKAGKDLYKKIYEGMTFQEIAKVQGVAVGTVTSRYQYGLERIRRSFEPKGATP